MTNAVKFVDGHDDLIEGMLAPYGSPARKDLDDEYFDAETDFVLDWFGDWQRPSLFGHGYDPALKTSVVGRIRVEPTDKGLWAQAQLDKHHAYYEQVRELISEGAVGWSSGSVDHLVEIEPSGHIKRWPLIEGSLTPTPANPDALGVRYAAKSVDIAEHLAVLGVAMPPDLVTVEDQPSQSVVPIPEVVEDPATKNVEPITREDVDAIHEAIKSLQAAVEALAKTSEPEPVPPEPLLAIAGKSAEPDEPVDLDAFADELIAHAIKEAKDILG